MFGLFEKKLTLTEEFVNEEVQKGSRVLIQEAIDVDEFYLLIDDGPGFRKLMQGITTDFEALNSMLTRNP